MPPRRGEVSSTDSVLIIDAAPKHLVPCERCEVYQESFMDCLSNFEVQQSPVLGCASSSQDYPGRGTANSAQFKAKWFAL